MGVLPEALSIGIDFDRQSDMMVRNQRKKISRVNHRMEDGEDRICATYRSNYEWLASYSTRNTILVIRFG